MNGKTSGLPGAATADVKNCKGCCLYLSGNQRLIYDRPTLKVDTPWSKFC